MMSWHINLSNNGRFDSEMIRVKRLEVLKTAITTEDSIPKCLEVEDNNICLLEMHSLLYPEAGFPLNVLPT